MMYKYITENNLLNRQNYMYSEFGGKDFLKAYVESRKQYLQKLDVQKADIMEGGHITYDELMNFREQLSIEGAVSCELKDHINAYIKTFEVRKRLYTEYDSLWKPVEKARYDYFDIYFLLAECLVAVYRQTKCAKYFSCFLKLNDTLLSVWGNLTVRQQLLLSRLLEEELQFYNKLIQEREIVIEEDL